jgi:LacI family transcriptional regulator
MRTTIKDVAKHAGVSVASVSFVLNGSGVVGAAVRARVLEAVEVLNYQRNQSATSMRTGRSATLGLIIPNLENPFFPTLARAVEESARRANHAILLIDSADGSSEAEGFELLTRYGVDGICWCPAGLGDTAARHAKAVPLVVIDRPMAGYDVVSSDHDAGGRLIAEMVVADGQRTIGLLAGPSNIAGADLRRDAFVKAIAPHAKIIWQAQTAYTLALSDDATAALASGKVDAIVCTSDVVAIAAIRALQARDIRVPDDVSVYGFDDIEWSTLITPELTTVRQSIAELGREAIGLLLSRISSPTASRRTVTLPVELKNRGSSRSRIS